MYLNRELTQPCIAHIQYVIMKELELTQLELDNLDA